MSSVTKDSGVSSVLLFSGSGINFPRPLYVPTYSIRVLVSGIPKKEMLNDKNTQTVKSYRFFLLHEGRIRQCTSPKEKENIPYRIS
jgi:hypothetical protein